MVQTDTLTRELESLTVEEFNRMSEEAGLSWFTDLQGAHLDVVDHLRRHGLVDINSRVYRRLADHKIIKSLGPDHKLNLLELTGYKGKKVSNEMYKILYAGSDTNEDLRVFAEGIRNNSADFDKGAFTIYRGNEVLRLYAANGCAELEVENGKEISVTTFSIQNAIGKPCSIVQTVVTPKYQPKKINYHTVGESHVTPGLYAS